MAHNIEKWKAEEHVRIALMRHRGDVLYVASLLNVDVGYVRRIQHKVKVKCSHDVSYMISDTLMTYIFEGYQSRVNHFMTMLRSLQGREQVYLSTCCHALYKEADSEHPDTQYVCTRCNKNCDIEIVDHVDIFKLKSEILEQLRAEDEKLIEFADKMGYTRRVPAPIVKNETFVFGGTTLSAQDRDVMSKLRTMAPADRDRMIEDLTRSIVDVDVVTESKPKVDDKGGQDGNKV